MTDKIKDKSPKEIKKTAHKLVEKQPDAKEEEVEDDVDPLDAYME